MDAIAAEQSQADIACPLVAFDDGQFDDVLVWSIDEIACFIEGNGCGPFFCDDAARYDVYGVDFSLFQVQLQALCRKILEVDRAAYGVMVRTADGRQIDILLGDEAASDPSLYGMNMPYLATKQ